MANISEELGDEYMLDAFEMADLDKYGYFVETHKTENKLYQPSFRDFKSKLSKYASQAEIEAENEEREKFEAQLNAMEDKNKAKTPEELQEEARAAARAAAAAKASLMKKRFPEDDYQDLFESGQVAVWSIIGLDVPDKIFILTLAGAHGGTTKSTLKMIWIPPRKK